MQQTSTEPAVYEVADLSTLFHRSKRWVMSKIADGSLPSLRLSGSLVLPRAPIDELLGLQDRDGKVSRVLGPCGHVGGREDITAPTNRAELPADPA